MAAISRRKLTKLRRAAHLGRRVVTRLAASVPVARRILRDAVVVFLYHEVSDRPSQFNSMFGLNVRPLVFAEQLELVGRHFHFIDADQLVSGTYRTPAALITFDDGNRSYFENALPLLRRKQIPSVMFVNMGPVKGDVCWSGLVSFLQNFEPEFGGREREPRYAFVGVTEAQVTDYLSRVDRESLFARVRAFRGAIAREEDIDGLQNERLVHLGNHLYNHYNATMLPDGRFREEYCAVPQNL